MTADSVAMQRRVPWRVIGWGLAVALILAPLLAMQFFPAAGVNWTLFDFVFAGVLFGGVGLLFEVAVRATPNWYYRGGAALGLAAGLLLIWINGAVGIIGDEDNAANFVFLVIILMAISGSVVAGGKARLMARAMLVAGTAQAIVGVVVAATGAGATEPPGPIGIFILIEGFAALWFGSAWLFRRAAT